MNKTLIYIFIFLISFTQSTLAQKKGKSKTPAKEDLKRLKLGWQDEKRVQTLLFDGILAKIKGNYTSVDSCYKELLKIDPNNDAAMYELAQLYHSKQDYDSKSNWEQSMYYAENAVKLSPQNIWYKLLYADVLSVGKDYAKAAQTYKQLIDIEPNNYNYYFDLAFMQINNTEYAEAVKTYDLIETKIGVNEEVNLAKQKLYLKLGNLNAAIKETEKLIQSDTSEPRYYLALAELYLASNMPDKAVETYSTLLKISPNNPIAHLSLAEYYRKTGNNTQYFEELKIAFNQPELPLETKAKILIPFIEMSKNNPEIKEQVNNLVSTITQKHQNEALAYIINADFLYSQNKKQEALTQYKKAAEMDNNLLEAWQQIMWLQYDLKKYDDLLKDSKHIIELFPNQTLPYYFNGLASMMNKNYPNASKSLRKAAIINGSENKDLATQIYSLLGEAFYHQQNYEDSNLAFEKALSFKPNDPTILNNYAYYLSLQKNADLKKALDLSQKSNELEPNNPSFEDTYAWILYKQKNYTEAKTWIEKSIKNGGNDSGAVLEHYGNILFQLKDTNQALKYWQQAKQKGGELSEFLDKKINDKKLYE